MLFAYIWSRIISCSKYCYVCSYLSKKISTTELSNNTGGAIVTSDEGSYTCFEQNSNTVFSSNKGTAISNYHGYIMLGKNSTMDLVITLHLVV